MLLPLENPTINSMSSFASNRPIFPIRGFATLIPPDGDDARKV